MSIFSRTSPSKSRWKARVVRAIADVEAAYKAVANQNEMAVAGLRMRLTA